ncbi:hypothetical protein Nepgr_019579 [Nepenthes gracilis]|uniref:Uncharacterized protein n=1 Tax=Nepenthes gracilis TaxID=150966 RepID=A0AAD3SU86_NEPGR|nr:hypothetical protein Nepgr_019579 [Nepenthes gracilis]
MCIFEAQQWISGWDSSSAEASNSMFDFLPGINKEDSPAPAVADLEWVEMVLPDLGDCLVLLYRLGGLDAGVSPLGSSSPPRLNMPCTSNVMSPVYSAPSIPPASCGALPFCPEVPKISPVTTHPCGADADNNGVSCSSVVQQNIPGGTQSGLSLNKIGKDYDRIETHHVSNSASQTDVISGPDFCPIQHPPNSGHQGLASPNISLNLEPPSDGSDSSGSASKSKKRGSKSSKKSRNSKGPKSSTPLFFFW